VAEVLGSYTQIDIVFEKDGKRFLETFPQNLLKPVADIFQRPPDTKSDPLHEVEGLPQSEAGTTQ